MALCNVTVLINNMVKYFVFGPLVLYIIIYLIKYKFTYKCCERFFFIIQEAVILTIYCLYIFNPSYIIKYELDLIALILVCVLEIILFIPKLISYCKSDGEDDGEVNPEQEKQDLKKSNSFGDGDFNNSNDYLRSPGGPSRSPPPRAGRR